MSEKEFKNRQKLVFSYCSKSYELKKTYFRELSIIFCLLLGVTNDLIK
jgi:hypothetical protein